MKAILIFLLAPFSLYCQTSLDNTNPLTHRAPLQLAKLQNPIEFDGKISEGEWDDITTLTMTSHWPLFNEKPNKETLFRVAYDEKFIYFSALCYDDPKDVQFSTFERDIWNLTLDQVTLILDTYNDNENGVIFVVTPGGSRVDVSLFNDAQGDEPVDLSWNSYWEARTTIHEQGWSAEARIPLTSLRFQPESEGATMGLIVYRYTAQKKQMDLYPAIPPDWGFWSFIKVSKAQDVVIEPQSTKRPWFVSPYALAAAGYHHELPEGAASPNKLNDNKLTAGLDVQHAITENMNLDLTFNTDFAQVEADDQVVNLSRFSLFFPEKRKFFLERSSIMNFGFENNNRLFYSRRIGIAEGTLVPLWGGARVVGRLGDYDLGALSMQSRKKGDLASENFSVLRLRKKVSSGNSYVGGIMTARTGPKGESQMAYGLDGIFNLFKNDYLKINVANSWASQDSLSSDKFPGDRKRLYALWENRSSVGFNYALSYSQVDRHYDPAMGFEERFNYKAIGNKLAYGWFASESAALRLVDLALKNTLYFSNNNGQLESHLLSPTLNFEWKKSNKLQLAYMRFYDRVLTPFELSDEITIPAKKYVNHEFSLKYDTPPVGFLNCIFLGKMGRFYDGDLYSISITPNYTISKYLTISGFYAYNRVSFSQNPDYKAHVARLKISTSLNVRLSMNAFVQMNSLAKLSVANFRLRYNQRDGNDFFLVYNAVLNHHARHDELLPFDDSQAVIVKYVHTFFVD